jgi:hypothetical protein
MSADRVNAKEMVIPAVQPGGGAPTATFARVVCISSNEEYPKVAIA